MIVCGCDVGNLFTKAVILEDDRFVAGRVQRTTGNAVDEIGVLLDALAAEAKIERERFDAIVSTGGGAAMVPGATYTEDEIHCVAAAAAFFDPDVDLAIHAGGQAIASMKLDEEGSVVDFLRNDKCASGSGRFLEMMARKLDVAIDDVDRFAEMAARAGDAFVPVRGLRRERDHLAPKRRDAHPRHRRRDLRRGSPGSSSPRGGASARRRSTP